MAISPIKKNMFFELASVCFSERFLRPRTGVAGSQTSLGCRIVNVNVALALTRYWVQALALSGIITCS